MKQQDWEEICKKAENMKLVFSNQGKYVCITREGLKEFDNYRELMSFSIKYETELEQEHINNLAKCNRLDLFKDHKDYKMFSNT